MKPYSNKTDRIDDRKNLYAAISKGDKARKKANRKEAKDTINARRTLRFRPNFLFAL